MSHRSIVHAACLAAAGLVATPALAGGDATTGTQGMTTIRVASGLAFPTFATHAPDDTTRLFILEKQGRIRILNLKTGVLLASFFLNIDSLVGGGTSQPDERGLLGLAFHPDYASNGMFWVNYTDNGGTTTLRRYTRTPGNPNSADLASGQSILTIPQPFQNHNGGWIAFGPDGYLYMSTGDGGSSNDPGNRAQTITNMLLGKILRIDVDGDDNIPGNDDDDGIPGNGSTAGYTNPPTNPFVGIAGDDQIWAYGLRNPWRPSFDRLTGDLYIADVGQFAVEEISYVPAGSPGGGNFGWRCMEGGSCTGLTGCTCGSGALTNPIHTYTHTSGRCSITGGYVYRGCAMPLNHGMYFFADYCLANTSGGDGCNETISGLSPIYTFEVVGGIATDCKARTLALQPAGLNIQWISSFGEDARGEIYICEQPSGSTAGEVFKIIPNNGEPLLTDLNCDGYVDISDLLELLADYGTCVGCASDTNGDDMTDITDLLALLADWTG
jgi:glucose/arabinose dehydrogenase